MREEVRVIDRMREVVWTDATCHNGSINRPNGMMVGRVGNEWTVTFTGRTLPYCGRGADPRRKNLDRLTMQGVRNDSEQLT